MLIDQTSRPMLRVVWMGLLLALLATTGLRPLAADTSRAEGEKKPETKAPAEAKKGEEKKSEEEKDEKDEDRYLAVVGGDVHTVSGPVLKRATVLSKNGKITALGNRVEVPEEAEVIDATGMKVYPGLVAVRSSGLAGSGSSPQDTFDPYSFNVVLALAHGITTVAAGNNAVKLTYGTLDGHVLRRGLFINLSYERRRPEQKRKVRADLERVRNYLRELNAYEIRKAAGDKDAKEPDKKWLKGAYVNYLRLLRREATAYVRASRTVELRDVCELVQDFGIDCVIERATEAWTMPAELGRSGVKLILTARQGRQRGADLRTNRDTGWNVTNPSVVRDHGVPFALIPASSGLSTLFGIPGRDLLALSMEAAFAVNSGLSNEAALEAVTLDAARVFGVDAMVGSLEVGKDADLIVADGDLLHYTTWVQYAVVNGRVAYDKEKESVVQHIRSRAPETAEEILQNWPRRPGDPVGRPMEEAGEGESSPEAEETPSEEGGS